MKKTAAIILTLLPLLALLADEMTLHDFMHDYTKPVMKKFKAGNSPKDAKKLEMILLAIPDFALEEDREKWKKFSTEALASKDYEKSCSGCHKPFKKPYKKKFRKRPIQVPAELLKKLDAR